MKKAMLALTVALMAGCTSTPRLAPIDRKGPVAFVVTGKTPAPGAASVKDTAVNRGSESGAKAGALAGALSGLACGPFVIWCAPLGALAGASAGVIAGTAVGLSKTLPKDKVSQLNERLTRLKQSVDPIVELRNNVIDRADDHWELTDNSATRQVTLEVQQLYLTSANRDRIALVMQVFVQTSIGTPRRATRKNFEFVSQESSLETWLDERSDVPETSLRSACQQIAAAVVSELALN